MEAAKNRVPGALPFVVSYQSQNGRTKSLDEFDKLAVTLFMNHVEELRCLGAER